MNNKNYNDGPEKNKSHSILNNQNNTNPNAKGNYYLNIEDKKFTDNYFNLLESGVDGDKITFTTGHALPSTTQTPNDITNNPPTKMVSSW